MLVERELICLLLVTCNYVRSRIRIRIEGNDLFCVNEQETFRTKKFETIYVKMSNNKS